MNAILEPDPTGFDYLFRTLCDLLDEEIERQETALSLCRAQGEALRARDVATLETRTRALDRIIAEGAQAAQRRTDLLHTICAQLGLAVKEPTLSELIHWAPEPWRRRLRELHERIRGVVTETRGVVHANAGLIRASQRIVNQSIDRFYEPSLASRAPYNPYPETSRTSTRKPVLIDQQG